MPTRSQVLLDPGLLSHREFAADEPAHLSEHPTALFILRTPDGTVGVRVEVLRAKTVAGPQRYDADTVGGEPHRVGNAGRSRALNRGLPQDVLVTLSEPGEGNAYEGMVDARSRVVCRGGRCRRLKAGIFGGDHPQVAAGVINGDRAHG